MNEHQDERGETLLELLVTLILMGLAVIGIMAGLTAVARLADHNARTTHLGNTAQGYAEELKQPVAAMAYIDCATAWNGVRPYPNIDTSLLPKQSGTYTVRVTKIEYAAPPSGGPAAAPTWGSACATDPGLQRLTIEITVSRGSQTLSETVVIVKRNARCDSYSSLYINATQGPC